MLAFDVVFINVILRAYSLHDSIERSSTGYGMCATEAQHSQCSRPVALLEANARTICRRAHGPLGHDEAGLSSEVVSCSPGG